MATDTATHPAENQTDREPRRRRACSKEGVKADPAQSDRRGDGRTRAPDRRTVRLRPLSRPGHRVQLVLDRGCPDAPDGNLSPPVQRLLVANLYSVGFIFVVLGRSELFTEQTTLAVLPTLGGRASVFSLLRLWSVVWIANILGAIIFAAIASLIGPSLGVIKPSAFGEIAHRLTDHPARAIFFSGVLAGWLMGLVSWLVAAGRDTISQLVFVWLVTASIGFAGLHHVILGAVEVFAGALSGQNIGPYQIGKFLLWATLGNTLGGVVFVAIVKYGLARPAAQSDSSGGH